MSIPRTEHDNAVMLFNWCQGMNIECWHLSQEVYTKSWNQKRIQKEAGVRSGVADYLIYISERQSIHKFPVILFIELKKEKISANKEEGIKGSYPKVSEAQIDFLEKMDTVGNVGTKIAYGSEEAIEFIESHLKISN